MFRKVLLAVGVAAIAASALAVAARSSGRAASPVTQSAPIEQGRIVGWPGGKGVIYPTAGFFSNPQIVAVGAISNNGTFNVQLPARVPTDLLSTFAEQCATLHSSNPNALSTFTGNYLTYQQGMRVGATHSGSTPGIASFTGFTNGATRSGFLYVDRPTTLTGTCERTISAAGFTTDFLQTFNLMLRKGWNRLAASFSTPKPGQVASHLMIGTGKGESWFFFRPTS